MDSVRKKVESHIYSQMSLPDITLSERDVAQKFGLQRSSVREIFLSMEGSGILQRMPRRGYRCVDYRDTDQETFYAIRYVVEHEALRTAIKKVRKSDINKLRRHIEAMKRQIKNNEMLEFCKSDQDFHTTLIAASKSKFLIKIFDFMASTLFASHWQTTAQATDVLYSHIKICDALEKKNWEEAEKYLKEHAGQNVDW